ncbi:SH2 domain-containing protein 4A isoform X2 [Alligator sinensis]|uniref:SH2 domain-containing protein 4A isoform X2 n=1 Tax=Alligator sinensis TaxID=38654 RepID=A0A3Q0GXV6_ALLSI|nr:SH2 domain-containing protein 4A isoform X2 [Alligator sinensis]
MLKQILADMYVDPDLLAELSEEQKQILFFKMRQEQVRRWKERETATDKSSTKKPAPRKAKGKSVKWKLGADSEVWVWVMGEHTLDKPYDMICDQILAQRAQQQPKEEVRESQALTKPSITWSLHSQLRALDRMDAHRNDRNTGEGREEEAMKVANAKERSQKQTQSVPSKTRDIHQMLADCHMRDRGFQQKKEETRRNPGDTRSAKETATCCEPNCGEMQESAQNSDKDNPEWQASLSKSKAADERRRSIARQARDDYRRLSLQGVQKSKRAEASKKAQDGKQGQPSHPPLPPKPKILNDGVVSRKRGVQRTISSSTEEGIIRWFKEEQYPLRAGYEKSADSIAPWFHGIVTSKKAEELLSKSVPGSFLVRISEKIKGYVLSYLSVEGCKHFLIDASSDSYSFLGVDQLQHSTLADLVDYHKEEPITSLGRELLLYPCGQQDHEPDYLDLFE